MGAATCAAALATIEGYERAEERIRKQQPFVRIWDGEWELQHILSVDYKSTFSWISNDTGPGQSEIPYDTEVAQWIHDMEGRMDRGEKRNVHVTVDYCGARWSGRLDKTSLEKREDGDEVLVVDWLHDYENLTPRLNGITFGVTPSYRPYCNFRAHFSSRAPSRGSSAWPYSSKSSGNTTL